MTAEQRQYLKGAIDAHRRAALAADGDVKFRQRKVEAEPDHLFPMIAAALLTGLVMALAILVSFA